MPEKDRIQPKFWAVSAAALPKPDPEKLHWAVLNRETGIRRPGERWTLGTAREIERRLNEVTVIEHRLRDGDVEDAVEAEILERQLSDHWAALHEVGISSDEKWLYER